MSDEYTPTTDAVREWYQNGPSPYDTAAGFDRWSAAHDAEARATTETGWEYGRRDRRYGSYLPLRGKPSSDWWGESQEDYEHVRRAVGPWEPFTEGGTP